MFSTLWRKVNFQGKKRQSTCPEAESLMTMLEPLVVPRTQLVAPSLPVLWLINVFFSFEFLFFNLNAHP